MKTVDFFSKDNIIEFIKTGKKECFDSDIRKKGFLKYKLEQLQNPEYHIKESLNVMDLVDEDTKQTLSKKFSYNINVNLVLRELLTELGIDSDININHYSDSKRKFLLKVLLINCNIDNVSDLIKFSNQIGRRFLINDYKTSICAKKTTEVSFKKVMNGGEYEEREIDERHILADLW